MLNTNQQALNTSTLFDLKTNSITMAAKLRRIHALNCRNSIRKITFVGHHHWVFEHIGPFGQPIKKEAPTRIFGAFVVTKSSLIFILAKHISWF